MFQGQLHNPTSNNSEPDLLHEKKNGNDDQEDTELPPFPPYRSYESELTRSTIIA